MLSKMMPVREDSSRRLFPASASAGSCSFEAEFGDTDTSKDRGPSARQRQRSTLGAASVEEDRDARVVREKLAGDEQRLSNEHTSSSEQHISEGHWIAISQLTSPLSPPRESNLRAQNFALCKRLLEKHGHFHPLSDSPTRNIITAFLPYIRALSGPFTSESSDSRIEQ